MHFVKTEEIFFIKFDTLGLYWERSCSVFTPTMSFTNIKLTRFTNKNDFDKTSDCVQWDIQPNSEV